MTILAAGGILWRDMSRSEFAVVHRRRHKDWCLPKGKAESGETLEAAARREVLEETGWEADLQEMAGEVAYDVGGEPKKVVFWNMIPRRGTQQQPTDPEEVEAVVWLELASGLSRLSYQAERSIVLKNARR